MEADWPPHLLSILRQVAHLKRTRADAHLHAQTLYILELRRHRKPYSALVPGNRPTKCLHLQRIILYTEPVTYTRTYIYSLKTPHNHTHAHTSPSHTRTHTPNR